jgi:hypothetical protein
MILQRPRRPLRSARAGGFFKNRANLPDFRTHLEGKIAWVEQINPPRAAKLRRLFDQIDWSSSPSPPTGPHIT